MMLQVVVPLTIVILTTLDLSFMLLESSVMLLVKINGIGVTHDDYHMTIKIFYSTSH